MKLCSREIFFLVLLFLLYITMLHWLSLYALTIIPNTGDENSVLFQAKLFSIFQFTAPAPTPSLFFLTDYIVIQNNKWFSAYPPIYSLMICLGTLAGSTLTAVAIYSSLVLFLVFSFAKIIFKDNYFAGLATILLWVSPTFIFHSISYYNHIGSILILLLTLILLLYIEEHKKYSLLWGIGLLLGIGAGIRPFTFFLLSIPIGIYSLSMLKADSQLKLSLILRLASPLLLCILCLYLYNIILSGDWWDIPYLKAGRNDIKLSLSNFSWAGWKRILAMLSDSSKWLFGLGFFKSGNLKIETPSDWNFSLVFGFAAVVAAIWEGYKNPLLRRRILLLLSLVFILVSGHIFYSFSGGRFGERFFFEITFIITLFGARLLWAIAHLAKKPPMQKFALASLAACLLLPNLAIYLPGTINFFHNSNVRRMDPYLKVLEMKLSNSVVFLHDVPEFNANFYARNEPDLSGNLFVHDRAVKNELLMAQYPNKEYYIYSRKSSGNGFQLEKWAK